MDVTQFNFEGPAQPNFKALPETPMPHVIGQIYHHYDFPVTEDDLDYRDTVYIVSIWRHDSIPAAGEQRRVLRNDCGGQVHDIIKFHTGIDKWSVKRFIQHLSYLNTVEYKTARGGRWTQPIWLEIMSPGGSVPSGIEMRSAIKASQRPVVPIISGMCASAATFAWTANQGCRLMQPGSMLLIHQMSEVTQGDCQEKLAEMKTGADNMQIWQKEVEKFYTQLDRGSNPRVSNSEYQSQIKRLMQGLDHYMPPDEAIKYGLSTGMFHTWKQQEDSVYSPANEEYEVSHGVM